MVYKMVFVTSSLMLLGVFVETASSQWEYEHYKLHTLPSPDMCSNGEEKGSLHIGPWKAAIVNFGHPNETITSSSRRDLHKCTIRVITEKEFGLAVVIEEMRILGTLDKNTNGWECDGDYIKLSTVGTSFITKILDHVPGGIFRSKTTHKLCGQRTKRNFFTEFGSKANIFSTVGHELEILFHQSKRKNEPLNNYFKIIITTFKLIKELDNCQDRYKCSKNYCIGRDYQCDTHSNCAFPGDGGDEEQCDGQPDYHPIFSTTTTIITVLAAIVGAGFVFGVLVTLIRKLRSCSTPRTDGMVGSSVGMLGGATAPPLQRQHTLPPYEAVVMADAYKANAPTSPDAPEVPPSYHTLFPDGPPNHVSSDGSPELPPSTLALSGEPSHPT